MIPPRNVPDLQRELRRAASSNEEFAHWQVVMANVIAGQFLDGAVMRGGAALKLRYGDADTRYTMDLMHRAVSTKRSSLIVTANGWRLGGTALRGVS